MKHSNYGIVFFNVLSVGIFCAYGIKTPDLNVFGENMTESMSRIIDTDMASEMTEYTPVSYTHLRAHETDQ